MMSVNYQSQCRMIHEKKVVKCIRWDQVELVYYEVLQSSQSINAERYRLQLLELNRAFKGKRPQCAKRQDKINFFHDNARLHNTTRLEEFQRHLDEMASYCIRSIH